MNQVSLVQCRFYDPQAHLRGLPFINCFLGAEKGNGLAKAGGLLKRALVELGFANAKDSVAAACGKVLSDGGKLAALSNHLDVSVEFLRIKIPLIQSHNSRGTRNGRPEPAEEE